MFEVMLGDPRSWGDQPELFERGARRHGAEALPDPARLPALVADLRTHWAGAE